MTTTNECPTPEAQPAPRAVSWDLIDIVLERIPTYLDAHPDLPSPERENLVKAAAELATIRTHRWCCYRDLDGTQLTGYIVRTIFLGRLGVEFWAIVDLVGAS